MFTAWHQEGKMSVKDSAQDNQLTKWAVSTCTCKRHMEGVQRPKNKTDFENGEEAWVTYSLLQFEPKADSLRLDSEHRH